MKRRTILRRSSALVAPTLAGCLSKAATVPSESDPGDGEPGAGDDPEDDGSEDAGGISVADAAVETVAADCASGDEEPTTEIAFDEAETAVEFSGLVTAGTPCHETVVEAAEYDESADRVAIALEAERGDGLCTDCVGALEYEGTVAFEGGLPTEAAVSYQGVALGSASNDGTDGGDGVDESGGDAPELAGSVIDAANAEPGEGVDDADVEFDRDANAVVVDGTIRGSDACRTAELGDVDYDAETDELSVGVVTAAADDADVRMCIETIVEIDYAAHVEFDGGLPTSVTVSHDGDAFVSAAHGSSSASGSASESTSIER